MIIIFKSQHHWVQWYVVIQAISRHDINLSLTNFAWKFHREIIWNFCFIRLLYQASVYDIFYIICSAIIHGLSKYHSLHNKGQSWHLTNDPSHMVESIGIQNDAFHEPIPGHRLTILWQNAVSDPYTFDHQWVNNSLGSMLEHLTRRSKVDHHDGVIKWKHFLRYWPFVRGIPGHRWIPCTKASDAELWYFLWSAPEEKIE